MTIVLLLIASASYGKLGGFAESLPRMGCTTQDQSKQFKLGGAALVLKTPSLLGNTHAQYLGSVETRTSKQFTIKGKLKSQIQGDTFQREVGYHVIVSNGYWRVKLLAVDPSAVFKEADFGGNGREIYLISRDWNNGMLAHVGVSRVPYPGSIEELSVLWTVYVLPYIGELSVSTSLENPFSNRIPRPLVNLTLNATDQMGLLFELTPITQDNLSRSPVTMASHNPVSRGLVQEWLKINGIITLPKIFEVELELDQGALGKIPLRRYFGVVTNDVQTPFGEPMIPPMPSGRVLTFLDTRYDNLEKPLAIGAFFAQGVWPSLADLKAYPEYRRWTGSTRFEPKLRWAAGTFYLLLVLVLTATLLWYLKLIRTNTKRRSDETKHSNVTYRDRSRKHVDSDGCNRAFCNCLRHEQ